MKFLLLLLFIAVPLAEIAVFIKVGDAIGIAATVALVILTAVIGVAMLKRQGVAVLARAQAALDAGELPIDSVLDGVCLLIAGALLLTPGLITDAVGFLLLVPGLRRGAARWAFERIKRSGRFTVQTSSVRRPPGPDGPGPVIEGEFEEVTKDGKDEEARKRGAEPETDDRSPWRR